MKRIALFFTILTLVAPLVAKADNPLRIKAGSLAALKLGRGAISFDIDLSQTKYKGTPLYDYLEQANVDREYFDDNVPEMERYFAEKWNKKIGKGCKIARSDDDAKYYMVVVVKTLQLGSVASAALSGMGGASVSGKVLFFDDGEGDEPFCEVEVLKQQGTLSGSSVAGIEGLKWVFNDLAENLCDLVKHSK